MKKIRLDQALVQRGLVATRSQAENYIKLGYILVDGVLVKKPGTPVNHNNQLKLIIKEQYVSRAALKLASVADKFKLDFKDKVVLDVGSSTGGFADYALRHGAKKVIAVDIGSAQMHPSLRGNKRLELHEKTDIRTLVYKDRPCNGGKDGVVCISERPDVVLVDVSFISLRDVLPHIAKLGGAKALLVALLKPQFEAGKEQR